MKKFFYSLILLVSFTSISYAQPTSEQKTAFLVQNFPNYMPKYVSDNMKVVPVTAEYANSHDKKYDYKYDVQSMAYQGKLRIGDTVLVFNDQPFFSVGQNLFISIPVKAKKIKTPKTAEERQQDKQLTGEIINGVLKTGANVFRNRNSSAGGGVNF